MLHAFSPNLSTRDSLSLFFVLRTLKDKTAPVLVGALHRCPCRELALATSTSIPQEVCLHEAG